MVHRAYVIDEQVDENTIQKARSIYSDGFVAQRTREPDSDIDSLAGFYTDRGICVSNS